jgi:hypothetical protein
MGKQAYSFRTAYSQIKAEKTYEKEILKSLLLGLKTPAKKQLRERI